MATSAPSTPIRSLARAARAGFGLFTTLLTVAVVVAMLLPPLFGYQRYVIHGGSMEPMISKGSIGSSFTIGASPTAAWSG